MTHETLQKWMRTLRLKKLLYSLVLIFLVLYPNLYLAGKQGINQLRGMDSLVDPDDPYVIALAKEAQADERVQSGEITIEEYILSALDYARDYDLYWNANYWASPAETIQKQKGDCEDHAIVVKSVQDYLGLEDSKMVIQPRHVYIERNGTIYGGKSSIDSHWQGIYDAIKSIPFVRQLLILMGLGLIWGRKPSGRIKLSGF